MSIRRTTSLLLLVASGCSGGDMHVRAHVTSAPCGAAETPAAGATVSMDCPQVIKSSAPSELGKTDAQGQFAIDEPLFGRWIHDGCDLIVEMPGFQTRRYPVKEVCQRYSANHCTYAALSAKLAPATACR